MPYLIDVGYGLKIGDEHYTKKSSEYVLIDVMNKIKTGKSPNISENELLRINSEQYIEEGFEKRISSSKALFSANDLCEDIN